MTITTTSLDGVLIIEPILFGDNRGYFYESFNKKKFEEETGLHIDFVQQNQSFSTKGVVRGLHFQKPPYAQAKLVRCVYGAVLDVAVDLRKYSATYGQYVAVELSENNHRQLFIPEGFAHGFSVLSDSAIFQYQCSDYYHPEAEGGVNLKSEKLGIDWEISEMKLSEKDKKWPMFYENWVSPF